MFSFISHDTSKLCNHLLSDLTVDSSIYILQSNSSFGNIFDKFDVDALNLIQKVIAVLDLYALTCRVKSIQILLLFNNGTSKGEDVTGEFDEVEWNVYITYNFLLGLLLGTKSSDSTDFEINSDNIKPETLKTQQSEDEFCNGIILSLRGDKKNKFYKKSRKYIIKQELLYFKNWSPHGVNNLLVIPKNLTNTIIKSYHESVFSGHFGITKTLAKLKQKYYWPTIIKDTTNFIKTCISCQKIKNPIGKGHGLLQPIPLLSGKPMQRLTFDYLGPLPASRGKKYLIVATCNATKMAFAKAVSNANGAATISFLMDLITSYGVPKYFCSDRGTHFKNKEVDYACKKLGITQIFSSAYHPQTQGMTELMNKIICNSLSHYVNENQKDWSLYYKMIIFAYNTSPSSRLKVSPFYLLHGIEATQPIDNKLTTEDELFDFTKALKQLQKIRDTIPKIVEKEQAVQKKQYDISHKNIYFKPGQKVLIKFDFNEKDKSKKLANKYRGPFTIIEKISDVNYKVDLILKGKKTIDIIHMFFKILTVIAVLINANAEEEIAVIVSTGAFFDEVPEAILYDKSIPLIYTQELQDDYPDDNLENIKKNWGVENYCENKNTNYCNIVNQTIDILSTINKNIRESDTKMLDFNKGLLNSRSKRGIQFFGNLYHFCCNVATEKQLKTFYTNEELLDQQINKFKNVFASDHKDLTNITTELNKYTKNTKNNIKLLKDSFSKFINEENINNLQEKTNQENMVQGIQEIIYNLISAILKITNNERDTNIYLHCKLHKIPARIIKSKILYNDLTKLKRAIERDGYELTIPLEHFHTYYNLPITECQFSKSKILIKIKIPIQEKSAKWTLYQYIPTHFKFHESI
ncbi:hypothetical protein AGLY_017349, partial [Aphis glycines]